MNKIDKLYSNYFGINTHKEVTQKKKEITTRELIKKMEKEKEMISSLIEESIDSNKLVEFSNAFYIDKDIIVPTISKSFANPGKTAILLSPNLETSSNYGFSTVKTSEINPYGDYYECITPCACNLKKILNAGVFVTEEIHPRLMSHFRFLSELGTPCVYATSGSLNKVVKNLENTKTIFKDATENSHLTYDMNVLANDDTACAIFMLKRK